MTDYLVVNQPDRLRSPSYRLSRRHRAATTRNASDEGAGAEIVLPFWFTGILGVLTLALAAVGILESLITLTALVRDGVVAEVSTTNAIASSAVLLAGIKFMLAPLLFGTGVMSLYRAPGTEAWIGGSVVLMLFALIIPEPMLIMQVPELLPFSWFFVLGLFYVGLTAALLLPFNMGLFAFSAARHSAAHTVQPTATAAERTMVVLPQPTTAAAAAAAAAAAEATALAKRRLQRKPAEDSALSDKPGKKAETADARKAKPGSSPKAGKSEKTATSVPASPAAGRAGRQRKGPPSTGAAQRKTKETPPGIGMEEAPVPRRKSGMNTVPGTGPGEKSQGRLKTLALDHHLDDDLHERPIDCHRQGLESLANIGPGMTTTNPVGDFLDRR